MLFSVLEGSWSIEKMDFEEKVEYVVFSKGWGNSIQIYEWVFG